MSKGATQTPSSTGHEGKASAPGTKPNKGEKGYAVSRYKCEEGITYGHGTAIKTTMNGAKGYAVARYTPREVPGKSAGNPYSDEA